MARDSMFRHTEEFRAEERKKMEEMEVVQAESGETEQSSADFNFGNNFRPGDVRDFKAFMPLLKVLGLDKYDRNDFSKFNIKRSLKELRLTWKTVDIEKIKYLMKYAIVHEVMKIEGRKAIRRANRDEIVERQEKRMNE